MRPIANHPGYHVDEQGRVYSTWQRQHVAGLQWEWTYGHAPVVLPQFDRRTLKGKPSAYLSVSLGRGKNRYVHELVCVAFHGPRPDGAEVCHGPGGSRDNSAANLRWDTKQANRDERVLCRGEAWQEAHSHAFSDLVGDS
jgi:hypothetical protein